MNALSPTLDGDPPLLAQMAALADPIRVRLLRLLDGRELAVAELCSVLQAPQSTVSRHLRALADEGWIRARAEATSRLYRLVQAELPPSAHRLWTLVREQADTTRAVRDDAARLEPVLAARSARHQNFFRSAATQWDRLRRDLFGSGLELACIAGLLDEDATIGDLGCGTGHLSAALAPFVKRVVAVDSSPEMLAAAADRVAVASRVELRHGTLEALPVANGELDAAFLCLVLHYVAEPSRVVREAVRTLRPGGRLVVVDLLPHERADMSERMGHVWPGFAASEVRAWFEGLDATAPRLHELPTDGAARGPRLFLATSQRRNGAYGRKSLADPLPGRTRHAPQPPLNDAKRVPAERRHPPSANAFGPKGRSSEKKEISK